MALWENTTSNKIKNVEPTKPKFKLSKGETLDTLIIAARK